MPITRTTQHQPAKWGLNLIDYLLWIYKCQVLGLKSLRVIDASVMPEIVNANTNATVMMIAEKAARQIKQDYR